MLQIPTGSQSQTLVFHHVQVFDSLPSGDGSVCTKEQIAALLCTKERQSTLDYPAVQIQEGGSDCGVFAVAFATPFSAVKKKSIRL